MRVAVVGGGVSGSYIARRLVEEDISTEVTIFDGDKRKVNCGITSCAWGVSKKHIQLACRKCNMDWYEFLEEIPLVLDFFGIKVRNSSIVTINKPKFVKKLKDHERINIVEKNVRIDDIENKFDLIVDATAWREIIGYTSETKDFTIFCWQCRIQKENSNSILRIGRIDFPGYMWEFPLKKYTHIGFGVASMRRRYNTSKSIESVFPEVLKALKLSITKNYRRICECYGVIRCSTPKYSEPLFIGNVITVGESAGMMSPLTGGGIAESIEGIEIILDFIDDLETAYSNLKKKFKWADNEFKIVEKMLKKERIGIRDLLKIRKNSERVGIKMQIRKAMKIMKAFQQKNIFTI